jgi:hypothetical protein
MPLGGFKISGRVKISLPQVLGLDENIKEKPAAGSNLMYWQIQNQHGIGRPHCPPYIRKNNSDL